MTNLDPKQLPLPLAVHLSAYYQVRNVKTNVDWSRKVLARLHVVESILTFPGLIAASDYIYRLRSSLAESKRDNLDSFLIDVLPKPTLGIWKNLVEQIWHKDYITDVPPFLPEFTNKLTDSKHPLTADFQKLVELRNKRFHPTNIPEDDAASQKICEELDVVIESVIEHYSFFSSYLLVGWTSGPSRGWWALEGNGLMPFTDDNLRSLLPKEPEGTVFLISRKRRELLPLSPLLEMVFIKDKEDGHEQVELATYIRPGNKSLQYYLSRSPEEVINLNKVLPISAPSLEISWEVPCTPWIVGNTGELFLQIRNKSYYPIESIEIHLELLFHLAEMIEDQIQPFFLAARDVRRMPIYIIANQAGEVRIEEGHVSFIFLGNKYEAHIPSIQLTCEEPQAPRFQFDVNDTIPLRPSTGAAVQVPIVIRNAGNKPGMLRMKVSTIFNNESKHPILQFEEEFALTVEGRSSSVIPFDFTPDLAGNWSLTVSWEASNSTDGEHRGIQSLPPLTVYWSLSPPEVIGRDQQINRLKPLLSPTLNPDSRLIELKGEVGTGKSRLLDEAGKIAAEYGYVQLRGVCEQTLQTVPFSAIRSCIGTTLVDTTEGSRLIHTLSQFLKNLEGKTLEINDIRWSQIRATEFIEGALKNRPLLLILDDIQWIDTASSDFLSFLLRNAKNLVKVVVAYRAEEFIATPSERMNHVEQLLRAKGAPYTIEVDPLTKKQTTNLVSIMLGQLPLPQNLTDKVFEETEGNPLFITHLIDSLRTEGSLYIRGNKWELRVNPQELVLPNKLTDVLLTRTKHLNSEQYEILEKASVIGRKFPLYLLAALCPCPEPQLFSFIDTCERYALIRSSNINHKLFSFAHGKIRDEIYNKISEFRRTRLHLRIAELIEELNPTRHKNLASLIANHLIAAEQHRKAVYWLYLDATTQGVLKSEGEIRSQYETIIDILKQYKDDDAVAATRIVKLKLAEFLIPTEESKHAGELFTELLSDLQNSNNEANLFDDAVLHTLLETLPSNLQSTNELEDTSETVSANGNGLNPLLPEPSYSAEQMIGRSHLGLGMLAQDRNHSKEARAEFEASLELLVPEDVGRGEAYIGLAWVEHDRGNLKEALELFDQGAQIFAEANYKQRLSKAHIDKARVLLLLGRLDEAEHTIQESLSISRDLKDLHASAYAYNNLGEVFRLGEQWESAERSYEYSIKLFQGCHHVPRTIFPICNQAKLYCQLGMLDKAEEKTLEAYRLAEPINRHTAGVALTTLAQIYWIRDSPTESLQFLDQAIKKVKGLRHPASRARLLKARVWFSTGNVKKAEAEARKVLKEFKREGDLFYQLLTEMLQAQIALNSTEIIERLNELGDPAINPFAWIRVRVHLLKARWSDKIQDSVGRDECIKKMVEEANKCQPFLGELAVKVADLGLYDEAAEQMLRLT